jgi:hypothetical protein
MILPAAKVGTDQLCMYCSCPFEVPEDGEETIPGPGDSFLVDALPENSDALLLQIDEALGLSALFPAGVRLSAGLEFALNALKWRVLRGNADLEEAGASARTLAQVAQMKPTHLEEWISPLPPEVTADLIVNELCTDLSGHISDQGGGIVEVKLTTGQHAVSGGADGSDQAAIFAGGLIGLLLMRLFKRAVSSGAGAATGEGEHSCKHLLCVEAHPVEDGAQLHYRHEWATGEQKSLTGKQEEIIDHIVDGLAAHAEPMACLRAVFGPWFNCHTMGCLNPESLTAWLAKLHFDLPSGAELLIPATS